MVTCDGWSILIVWVSVVLRGTDVSSEDCPFDKHKLKNRQGAVDKINCSDCHTSHFGKTGKNQTTRMTEHKWATRKGDVNNWIAEHHQLTNHTIDWDSVQCLTYSTNYFQQLTLESWCPNSKQTSLNRCDLLLPPYAQLIHNINITNKLNRTTLLYQTIKADLSWPTHATWVLQPITSRQIWPISS